MHQRGDGFGHTRCQRTQVRRRVVEMSAQQRHGTGGLERRPTGKEMKPRATERLEVTTRIHRVTTAGFRRQVERRTHDRAFERHGR